MDAVSSGREAQVDELRRRETLAQDMGGEERVARQRAAGRWTVRERIAALLDPGSWRETGEPRRPRHLR